MANQFLICYSSTVLLCVICILYMARRMNGSIGNGAEIKALYFMTFWELAVAVSQVIWAISMVHPRVLNPVLLNLIDFGDMFGTVAVVYSLYRFIEPQLVPMEEMRKKTYHRFSNFVNMPLIIMLGLDLTTTYTHWIYYTDALDHYYRGPIYNIQVVICLFYVAAAISLIISRRRMIERDRQMPVLLAYILLPTAGIILQVVLGSAPFGLMSMVLATLILFIYMQSKRIYTDLLTGLNNHGRAMDFLTDQLASADKKPFYLFMCDIDRFKQINDTKGHVNGDLTLICVSRALVSLTSYYPRLFISRFGGDEFMLVLPDQSIDPEKVKQFFREELQKELVKEDLSFSISVSIGYAYVNQPLKLTDVINQADAQLYKHKKIHHRKHL